MQTWTARSAVLRTPADASGPALPGSLAGDAVADPGEAAELLDVDVDQFAGALALVAPDRLGRLQGFQSVEPEPAQDAADGGRRQAGFLGNLCAAPALTTQRRDPIDHRCRCRPVQAVRPRAAVAQAVPAFRQEPRHPLAHGALAQSQGRGHGPGTVPFNQDPAHKRLSTQRRQTGILVNVHSVPPLETEVSTTSAFSVGTEWTTC